MHFTAEKVFWIISIIATLGMAVAGLRARQADDACQGGEYGVDYATCVKCIGAEDYCRQIWLEFADEATPTLIPTVNCNEYTQSYETCLACINQAYCDQIFRRGTQTTTPLPETSSPTPTAKPKSTAKPAPVSTPMATSTPTPTPTPTVNCNEYTQNYQTCLACINQAFCDQLFD